MSIVKKLFEFVNALKDKNVSTFSTVVQEAVSSATQEGKEMLSNAIAIGVNNGIKAVMPLLMKVALLSIIFLMGIVFVGIGIARWAETLFASPGTGFIIVGIAMVALASIMAIYLQK